MKVLNRGKGDQKTLWVAHAIREFALDDRIKAVQGMTANTGMGPRISLAGDDALLMPDIPYCTRAWQQRSL